MNSKTIFWFRRDLRLKDNAALYYALKENKNVQCIFIFDTNILEELDNKKDARIHFIHHTLIELNNELKKYGAGLKTYTGKPIEIVKEIIEKEDIKAIYTNHDYEPYAVQRDKKVSEYCGQNNVVFKTFKDQTIFEKDEILKDNGEPYSVFTPYSKRWKIKLNEFYVKPYPTEKYFSNFSAKEFTQIPTLKSIGFEETEISFPTKNMDIQTIKNYHKTRDIPYLDNGTTHLSVHLRFGTISVRELAKVAQKLNEKYLNELIWRDFYMMILWHYPQVITQAFKPKYDNIKWRNNESEFKAWCDGKTGFPIVDAGMRQLNKTGYMHNRVRMIVASFLVKDLLIDWRWGEAYFAQKLLDYDLAANNGGWQWAAGSGCDAAPYFRIFNPESQLKKFDSELKYVRKWIKEYDNPFEYPKPIIDRKISRQRALDTYKDALK